MYSYIGNSLISFAENFNLTSVAFSNKIAEKDMDFFNINEDLMIPYVDILEMFYVNYEIEKEFDDCFFIKNNKLSNIDLQTSLESMKDDINFLSKKYFVIAFDFNDCISILKRERKILLCEVEKTIKKFVNEIK